MTNLRSRAVTLFALLGLMGLGLGLMSCSDAGSNEAMVEDQTAINVKAYTDVWDKIINEARPDLINEEMFAPDVVLYAAPENVVGIDSFRSYYENYTTGFSDVEFTMVDVFGSGDKIVKHWRFKGTHTGDFFGIPATGREIDIEGATLVLMKDGKIQAEQDFMDNLDFYQQLGLLPAE